jgi:hypothetical protein
MRGEDFLDRGLNAAFTVIRFANFFQFYYIDFSIPSMYLMSGRKSQEDDPKSTSKE